MEENQAMMSRAELQSMISQLEEAEQRQNMISKQRGGSQMTPELSGIRTNPGELMARKRSPITQGDRQLCWRYFQSVVAPCCRYENLRTSSKFKHCFPSMHSNNAETYTTS